MKSPKFEPWKITLEYSKEYGPHTPNSVVKEVTKKIYRKLLEAKVIGTHKISVADFSHIQAEMDWHCIGRPYYKLWPEMLEQLSQTTMNFSPEYVESPFGVFAVMFPVGYQLSTIPPSEDPPLPSPRSLHPTSVLVRFVKKSDGIESFRPLFEEKNCDKIIAATFRESDEGTNHIILPFDKDKTVEESLSSVMQKDFPELESADARSFVPVSERLVIWKLCVATMMFATQRHEMVLPDVSREELERRFPGGASNASKKIAKEKQDRYASKIIGWRVGSEIDIPRRATTPTGETGDHHSLQYSHIRSGHMKMQPCGAGNKDRKLIYIAPTIVRPDLPVGKSHGYRIRQVSHQKGK